MLGKHSMARLGPPISYFGVGGLKLCYFFSGGGLSRLTLCSQAQLTYFLILLPLLLTCLDYCSVLSYYRKPLLILFCFGFRGMLCSPGWPPSPRVVEDDMKRLILLPLPLECAIHSSLDSAGDGVRGRHSVN